MKEKKCRQEILQRTLCDLPFVPLHYPIIIMFRHYYNDIQILSTVDEINSLDGRSSFK